MVATVDYRLSGEARFPAQLHDVKAAIRWVRGNASQLGVDPSKVLAWGESAGGHLAMLAGLTAGSMPELPRSDVEGEVGQHLGESSAVCGVVDWYGPMNLLSLSAQHRPDSDKRPDDAGSWESSMVGAPLQTDPARTRSASPISYVHADGATDPDPSRHRRRRRCRSPRASSSSRRCATPAARPSSSPSRAATTSGPARPICRRSSTPRWRLPDTSQPPDPLPPSGAASRLRWPKSRARRARWDRWRAVMAESRPSETDERSER